ncbi:MAG: hypothetical protein ABL995_16625 [Bryobacteraceae bacterium]
MKDAILLAISQPAIAAGVFIAGWIGIVLEFLFPAKVIPGALGGVLLLLSLWSLLPEHAALSVLLAAGMTLLTVPLLWIAWRARRNKVAR